MSKKNVGNSIRFLRTLHNMTQSDLATRLQISRQAVSFYETGVRLPDIYTLWKMADLFGVNIDELVGRSN